MLPMHMHLGSIQSCLQGGGGKQVGLSLLHDGMGIRCVQFSSFQELRLLQIMLPYNSFWLSPDRVCLCEGALAPPRLKWLELQAVSIPRRHLNLQV
jgi:hypothetical protein